MTKAGRGRCELCLRDDVERTIHHDTDGQYPLCHRLHGGGHPFGGGPEDTSQLCIPCHKQLHALYSNSELAIRLNTIERLQDDPEMKKYLNWIKKQPAGKLPRIKKSSYRGH